MLTSWEMNRVIKEDVAYPSSEVENKVAEMVLADNIVLPRDFHESLPDMFLTRI